MAFVSATRLRLRSPIYLPLFYWRSWKIVKQVRYTSGFIGGKLLQDKNFAFWTLTLWEQKTGIKMLRDRGSHKMSMDRLAAWCDESSVVSWQQKTSQIPSFR